MDTNISDAERLTLERILSSSSLQLIYTDGSFLPSTNRAGFAWAHFTHNGDSEGGAIVPNFIQHGYGPVLDRSNVSAGGDVGPIISKLSNNVAEIAAMHQALMYIDNHPGDFMGKHILIRYDSEVARQLITEGWQAKDTALQGLVHETSALLRRLNYERLRGVIELNQGNIPLTSLEAFRIQFQHITAHKDLDLGNNWVDSCAKDGAAGFTNDHPRAPGDHTIEQRLQRHVPGIAQSREANSEIQSPSVDQDLPTEVEFAVSNLLDDFGNNMEDLPYWSLEDLVPSP